MSSNDYDNGAILKVSVELCWLLALCGNKSLVFVFFLFVCCRFFYSFSRLLDFYCYWLELMTVVDKMDFSFSFWFNQFNFLLPLIFFRIRVFLPRILYSCSRFQYGRLNLDCETTRGCLFSQTPRSNCLELSAELYWLLALCEKQVVCICFLSFCLMSFFILLDSQLTTSRLLDFCRYWLELTTVLDIQKRFPFHFGLINFIFFFLWSFQLRDFLPQINFIFVFSVSISNTDVHTI